MSRLFEDRFNKIFDRFLKSSLFEMEDMESMMKLENSSEGLTEETFEVTKGNVKTIITYKFNSKGFPVSYSHESTTINDQKMSREELEAAKNKAVENEDFISAMKYR